MTLAVLNRLVSFIWSIAADWKNENWKRKRRINYGYIKFI